MNNMENSILIGAAYIRVSTDGQLDYSPESQLDEIILYAKKNGIILPQENIFVEDDGISGRNADNRPAFQNLIASAKQKPKPFDVVLVWKFSRFARNQDESTFYKGMLRKKLEIDVISVSEPMLEGMYGRLIEMIIEWQDEFYSYNLAMEVKRGMKKKAMKGLYNGQMPFGYSKKANEMPIIVEEEAFLVRKIFDMFTGGYDKNYIVRQLNDLGYRTKRGNKFDNDCISYILSNPFYIGKVRWNRRASSKNNTLKDESEWIVVDAKHPPLIPVEAYEKAQSIIKQVLAQRSHYSHPISHTTHWLSGMVKCSICTKSLSIKFSPSSNGKKYASFQCLGYRRGIHNDSQSVSEKILGEAVINSLHNALDSNIIDFEVIKTWSESDGTELKLLTEELSRIELKQQRIKQAYIDGIDSLEEYKTNKNFLKEKKSTIEIKIRELSSKTINKKELDIQFRNSLKTVINILENESDYKIRATALRSIVKKIVFYKQDNRLKFYYYIAI